MTKTLSIRCPRCKRMVELPFDPDAGISESFVRRCFARCNDCFEGKTTWANVTAKDAVWSPCKD
jgi:hypothetical protein